VDVPVDEAGQDQTILDMCGLDASVLRADIGIRAEILNLSVLKDEKAIGVKTSRFLFIADVLPRVVDEIEKSSSNGRQIDQWVTS